MCVCRCTRIYIYTHICIYIYVCMYVCMYVYTHKHTHRHIVHQAPKKENKGSLQTNRHTHRHVGGFFFSMHLLLKGGTPASVLFPFRARCHQPSPANAHSIVSHAPSQPPIHACLFRACVCMQGHVALVYAIQTMSICVKDGGAHVHTYK